MHEWTIPVPGTPPGTAATLHLRRFGREGARPAAFIQAGLHADEVPPMLVAHHLSALLRTAEAADRLRGEVVLAPAANPLGLAQTVLGTPVGRFDLRDGRNFNRGFPCLGEAAASRVAPLLGADPAANLALVRAALEASLAALPPAPRPADRLKQLLLGLAVGADLVLDLHCGSEAVPHLYTLTPLAGTFAPLSALMGAQAVLLATESGDDPFDEACSRPWHHLRNRFPANPIPFGCAAATLEFRGEADVSHALARRDAEAVFDALVLAGTVEGPPPAVPPAPAPVDLAAAEPLLAPASGMLVFAAAPGAVLAPGALVAEIVDPLSARVEPVRTTSGGVLFTRTTLRFVLPGTRLGTVAAPPGASTARRSNLLSD